MSKVYVPPLKSGEDREPLSKIWQWLQEKENFGEGVILNENYFKDYINWSGYSITKYDVYKENNNLIILRTLDKSNDPYLPVIMNEGSKKEYLRAVIQRNYENRRRHILPIDTYQNLFIKNAYYDGFADRVQYSSHLIILPFKNFDELERLERKLKQQISSKDRDFVKNIIEKDFLKELVPVKLIDWIKENTSQKHGLAEEEIYNSYVELIVDILFSRHDSN